MSIPQIYTSADVVQICENNPLAIQQLKILNYLGLKKKNGKFDWHSISVLHIKNCAEIPWCYTDNLYNECHDLEVDTNVNRLWSIQVNYFG